MDAIFNRRIDFMSLLKLNDINSDVQRHLSQVYSTLAAGLLLTGACIAVLPEFLASPLMGTLLSIGAIFALSPAFSRYMSASTRFAAFAGMCVGKAMLLKQFITMLLDFDPYIIPTALGGTIVVFACFSLFSLVSKRRSLLYLGGLLSSALSWLVFGSMMNYFFRSSTFFSLELYIGLFLFVGYVVFDTQLIVEKAAQGDKDFLWHAVELYVDFVNIFVRIAIILAKNSKSDKKSSSRR